LSGHPGVAAELPTPPPSLLPVGLTTLEFNTLTRYMSRSTAPTSPSMHDSAGSRADRRTASDAEVERLAPRRIGKDIFHTVVMDYWGARCPITGITDPASL
jgi:hypothetical protein